MRVYLAATSNGMNKELREQKIDKCRPKYVLETFFNGEKKCLIALNMVGNDNFLLDSGAFSYMNGAKVTLEQMNTYVDRYIEFIKQNNIKHFFEIDVDNIFGLEQVEMWRKQIESSVGRQCIPVWHKGRGVDYWKRLCSEYKYIAIGGFAIKTIKSSEYDLIKQMINYAYKNKVKVHGLGFTKTRELNDYKFYSVDSASWVISATRGQQIHFFRNGHIKSRQLEKGNKKVKLSELVAHNLKEWVKYQKYMDMRRY